MRLPRDLSGDDLVKALRGLGYEVTRHNPLRIGTLAGILSDVAEHFELSREDLVARLFGEKQ